jgi:hypothetical protein
VEEVRSAIRDMADMLDSLLLFAPTGQSLRPGLESLNRIIEHAVDLVRFHPSAPWLLDTLWIRARFPAPRLHGD